MPQDPNAAVDQQNAQIKSLYDSLQGNLQAGQGATANIYTDASSGVGNAYDSALGAYDQTMNDLRARIGRSASMLGTSDALPEALSGLEGTLAANKLNTLGQKANDLGALGRQGAAYQAVGQRAINDAGQQGVTQQADLGTKLRNAILGYNAEEESARGDIELQKLQNQNSLEQMRAENENTRLKNEFEKASSEAALNDPEKQLDMALKEAQLEKLLNPGASEIKSKGFNAFQDLVGGGQISDDAFAVAKDLWDATNRDAAYGKEVNQPIDPAARIQEMLQQWKDLGYLGGRDVNRTGQTYDPQDLEAQVRMALGYAY